MRAVSRRLVTAAAVVAGFGLAAGGQAADKKEHRVVFQVDQNDPAVMNLTLNNVANLMEYYHDKGEQAQIEVVAYGPGLNMFRDDKSPVKDRIARMKSGAFPSNVAFSACGNTKKGMEKAEGHRDRHHPGSDDRAGRHRAPDRVAGAGLELHPAVRRRFREAVVADGRGFGARGARLMPKTPSSPTSRWRPIPRWSWRGRHCSSAARTASRSRWW